MSDLADPLLPPNATALEEELARLSGALDRIDPSVIETIWDAWRCPAPLLSWLAWALSVDFWDASWDEIRKRRTIADSPAYHRRKGTRATVQSILDLAQRPYELHEWWQRTPNGRRGTSRVHIEAGLAEVPAVLRAVRPLLIISKPKSRPIVFGAGEVVAGPLPVITGVLDETLTTVEPFAYLGEDRDGVFHAGIGLLIEELTTIEAIP